MVSLAVVGGAHMPDTGAVTALPNPTKCSGGSGRTSDARVNRAERPFRSTGVKSMA